MAPQAAANNAGSRRQPAFQPPIVEAILTACRAAWAARDFQAENAGILALLWRMTRIRVGRTECAYVGHAFNPCKG